MRYVKFDPDDIDREPISAEEKAEFRSWYKRAERARRSAVTKFEATNTISQETEEIWREHKLWLLRNKFCGKCAYCEKQLTDVPASAEHWRPKRAVTGADGHPGYFWLAYSWFNLLPSCDMCNAYGAKHNQFPVERRHIFRVKLTDAEHSQLIKPADAIPSETVPGEYYLGPQDLNDREHPLLLHPYVDVDASVDLEFTRRGGVKGRTLKGESSIKVFGLYRDDLKKLRRTEADHLRTELLLLAHRRARITGDYLAAIDAAEADMMAGFDEYTPFFTASAPMLEQIAACEREYQSDEDG